MTPAPFRAAAIFHRYGPYHIARLATAAEQGEIIGIELAAETNEYAWDAVPGSDRFRRITLVESTDSIKAKTLARRLVDTLAEIQPSVVFTNGWSGVAAVTALRWCVENNVPAVLMSESTKDDEPRRHWKEWIKRRIVRCFSAALVGGRRHIEYAIELGIPEDRIFIGYDAVDNNYFTSRVAEVRTHLPVVRKRRELPKSFFLALNRFIPKKNLIGLLRSFAEYRQTVGQDSWELVLLGDGPLRPEIEFERDRLGLRESVHLPGFKQYDELPDYFGAASVFVHASTSEQWGLVVNEAMASGLPVLVSERCGCVPELVQSGITGFTFDPSDQAELARLMAKMAATDEARRAEMSRAAALTIDSFSPKRFCDGFWKAAHAASDSPRVAAKLVSRLIVRMASGIA